MNSISGTFYEFEGFRLDPVRRLLTRGGAIIPLKPKVFDTLLVLVSRSGRVVEKEDLLKEVWGGLAVEEIGLTKNISTLRKALGESPDEHRYIVTVPGRGYSFVAHVTSVSVPAAGLPPVGMETEIEREVVETQSVARLTSEDEVIKAEDEPRPSLPRRRHAYWPRIGIAGMLMLAGIALLFYFRNRPALTDKDSILLADFVNRTSDPVFDETLEQGLAVQLEQSPVLDIFSEERVRRTLRFMGRSPDERVTPAIAREICQREGLKAFIVGSVAALGTHYVITLEAIEGQTGAILARVQAEAENKEQVLRKLSEVASRMRRSLGESLGSIRKYDALIERTTSSLEALQALSLGAQERRRGRTTQAMAFYQRALELDPNFAFAYSRLAVAYRNSRQPALAAEYAAKAYALRDRLSERERLEITSLYHELVTGDIGKNIEALQIFQRIYPKEATPPNNLAVAYVTLGQFDLGVEEGRIAMRLDPTVSIRYAVLGNSLIRLNRFAEASDVYRGALERKLENFSVHRGLFRIAFVNQDTAAMERELSWASRNSHEDAALEWQAKAAAFAGEWQRSVAYAARAIEAANRMQEPEVAAAYAAESALWGAAMGQCSAVRGESSETPSAAAGGSEEDQLSLTRMGLALALCGETGPAQSKVAEIKRRYPQNTLMNWIWLPAIQSALEMKSGNAARAVDLLEPARHYEAAAEFWPQYLRAQAYLRLGRGDEAAAEFSKILGHSGQDVASPLYPLANLGLAQSMDLQHEIAKARKSAEAFLLEWKEADSDQLFLKEAREQFGHAQ